MVEDLGETSTKENITQPRTVSDSDFTSVDVDIDDLKL
jgi:hypothetical protein